MLTFPPRSFHRRDATVFVLVFLLCFGVQTYTWFVLGAPDSDLWSRTTQETAQHFVHAEDMYATSMHVMYTPAFVYLGTTIILTGSALMRMGIIDPVAAFKLAARARRLTLYCAYRGTLRTNAPTNLWRNCVAALLIFTRLYHQGPSASTVAILPLITLLVCAFFAIMERAQKHPVPLKALIALGVIGGVALATRLDISMLMFATGLCVIAPH